MHLLTIASVAFTAAASVSAIVIPHHHGHVARQEKPATYYEGYLEKYDTYHARYLALDCEAKHNTTFFDKCCHPMLATETLEKNRAPECNPANLVSSTVSSAAPTQTDDDDCDDDEPTAVVSSAAPTSTDDEGDDCDDDEPTSTVTPSPAHVTTSTHSSSTETHSDAPTSTQAPATTHTSSTQAPPTTHTTSTHSTTHSTTKATSTKTAAPAATTTASSSGGNITGGQATFFFQGGQAGACGTVHQDSAFIAALQTERYGDLSQQSSNCGRKITLTNNNNGKSVTVTVADACPTCGNKNDLDLSVAAFVAIATEEEGQVPITWHFDD